MRFLPTLVALATVLLVGCKPGSRAAADAALRPDTVSDRRDSAGSPAAAAGAVAVFRFTRPFVDGLGNTIAYDLRDGLASDTGPDFTRSSVPAFLGVGSALPGTRPLYRCRLSNPVLAGSYAHFLSKDAGCEGVAEPRGKVVALFVAPGPGHRTPVYRCHGTMNGGRIWMSTTSAACENDPAFQMDGVLGYEPDGTR